MDSADILNPAVLVPVAVVLVLLIGVSVAVVTIMTSKKKKAALDAWARGAYGLWTGLEDSASWPAQRAQNALRDWYGANSSVQAQEAIKDVARGQTGNAAWDKCRALDMLRIALSAGYVDADQCRTESAKIAIELQRQYRGWDDLAQAFEMGMHSWQQGRGVNDPQELGRVQKNLPELRAQVWPRTPWNTPLVAPDD
jgi:hypothetical protein